MAELILHVRLNIDAGGSMFSSVNIDRFTPRNDRAFVGFISKKSIKEIVMVINRGIEPAGQNEGIDAIKVAETAVTAADHSLPMSHRY